MIYKHKMLTAETNLDKLLAEWIAMLRKYVEQPVEEPDDKGYIKHEEQTVN